MLEFLMSYLEIILHIDKYLTTILERYSLWIYVILFLIIFLETGLVFTPFLPGDSLLFAVGALAAVGSMNILVLYFSLLVAAILGDTVNYWIGAYIGPKIFHKKILFIKREYLIRTEKFYEMHGNKTIVLARFIPVIRTFAPFVAGVGKMKYPRFLFYNIMGGFAWIALFLLGGYYFGNVAWVKENFSLTLVGIIVLSFIPFIVELIKHKRKSVKSQ